MGSGEVVGLLGLNGAGKTTVFYMIVGFIRPTAGRIFLSGEDITRLPMFRRARAGISYLPQEPSVFRKLTVEQNLLAVLETQRGQTRSSRRQRCDQILDELGLGGSPPAAGLHALRRRAAPHRDRSRAGHETEVSVARRAVCGHRPDRRTGYQGHREPPRRSRHRGSDHRPQRSRHPGDKRTAAIFCARARSWSAARAASCSTINWPGSSTSGATFACSAAREQPARLSLTEGWTVTHHAR